MLIKNDFPLKFYLNDIPCAPAKNEFFVIFQRYRESSEERLGDFISDGTPCALPVA